MDWINYHHLLYFWLTAKEGSVTRAAQRLMLAQPTVSGQIRMLERAIGTPLFDRRGRSLVLTERGRMVYSYADRIFTIGQELTEALRGRDVTGPRQVRVGVADALPKAVVASLIEPAMDLEDPVHVICHEDKTERLLADLTLDAYDIVLADAPIGPGAPVRAFNHALGESAVAAFGTRPLANAFRRGFPGSLDQAPVIMPTSNTTLRRELDAWFEKHEIRPRLVGEFEDSALLKAFGQRGKGLFFAPVVAEEAIVSQYDVRKVGVLEGVTEQFYAISVHRRLRNPAAIAIRDNARARLGLVS